MGHRGGEVLRLLAARVIQAQGVGEAGPVALPVGGRDARIEDRGAHLGQDFSQQLVDQIAVVAVADEHVADVDGSGDRRIQGEARAQKVAPGPGGRRRVGVLIEAQGEQPHRLGQVGVALAGHGVPLGLRQRGRRQGPDLVPGMLQGSGQLPGGLADGLVQGRRLLGPGPELGGEAVLGEGAGIAGTGTAARTAGTTGTAGK